MTNPILVVEDDPAVRAALDRALRAAGHEVVLTGNGLAALAAVQRVDPALVVLDLGLPGMDGLSVCRRLRADGDDRPVLVLTARDALEDRVQGLDVGADDYLVKPFALEELLARIRALLRRTTGTDPAPLRIGDLVIDPDAHRVRRGPRELQLTDLEFRLLLHLAEHARHVRTSDALLAAVWDPAELPSKNTLEVYVGYLRRKLEAGGEPRLLHTVRGVGYVLRPAP